MPQVISEIQTVFRDRRWSVLATVEEMDEETGEVMATRRLSDKGEVILDA